MSALVGERNVLANEHADAYAGHVETIEEGLNVVVDLHTLTLTLVLEDALGNGGDNTVMSALDLVKCRCEAGIVVVQLRWPVTSCIISGAVVSSCGANLPVSLCSVGPMIQLRFVLAARNTGILCRLAQDTRCLAIIFGGF